MRRPIFTQADLQAIGEARVRDAKAKKGDGMSLIEREAVICTTCWQVIAIDGENNLDRIGSICSHLSMGISVVPAEQLRGAVEERDYYRAALERMAARQRPDGLAVHTLACARSRFGGQYAAPAASDGKENDRG